jgi:hypothetical protein
MINDTTLLTVAEAHIERLTLDIDRMKTELDAERKANSDQIKLFQDYMDAMIKLEVENPSGDDIKCLKLTLEVFNEVVAK